MLTTIELFVCWLVGVICLTWKCKKEELPSETYFKVFCQGTYVGPTLLFGFAEISCIGFGTGFFLSLLYILICLFALWAIHALGIMIIGWTEEPWVDGLQGFLVAMVCCVICMMIYVKFL